VTCHVLQRRLVRVDHQPTLATASSVTCADATFGPPPPTPADLRDGSLIVEPIRFQRPQLPAAADIEHYLAAARETRWFSNRGPCHRLLTDRLGQFLGGDICVVLMANATLGLVLALRTLLGESPAGSLVVVPSFTFPATAQAIRWNGLHPLWADVEPDGWHLDPRALRKTLATHGADVAAVLACSTFGTAPTTAQSTAWHDACAEAGVPLIVDSAPGFGARDELGRPLGAQGDAEVFSFHATKPFAIGEGGAVTTVDCELADRLATMTNFAFGPDHEIRSPFGLNAKLSEVHAAIGLAALDRFDDVLRARRVRSGRMQTELEQAGYRFQTGARSSTWQFVPVLAPSADVRDAVLVCSREQRIEIRSYHAPLHLLPAFAAHPAQEELPVTEDLARRALSLPLANDLSEIEIRRIVAVLLDCAGSPSRAEEVGA
jgi:dTDP-4-amino-4,6-dideoxygalactose transaminase